MVSLCGSSDAYMPMDDPSVQLGRGQPLLQIHDRIVFGDDTVLGKNNVLVGNNIEAAPDASKNIVLSENVTLASGVKNVISIGRRNRRITRSDFTEIGDFLLHDGETGTLTLLKDAIVAETDGPVQIGGVNGLTVRRSTVTDGVATGGGVEMNAPVKLVEKGACSWSFGLQTSDNAPDAGASGASMRDLVLKSDNGAQVVFSDQFTPALLDFTGQHRCVLRSDSSLITEAHLRAGTVLISTGAYAGLDGEDVTVDEAIPVVAVCARPRDPRVFGVLSSIEDAGPVRHVRIGNISFDRPKVVAERRVVVNAAGEGGILVCGENGDIANGDYLCSSTLEGVAMRQTEPYRCTFTVGKSTTFVAFACRQTPVMVGCVYS